jgi:type II secretory ATPase GspE/PulE/Tfp pilus assembly ATPase PilB-like protein
MAWTTGRSICVSRAPRLWAGEKDSLRLLDRRRVEQLLNQFGLSELQNEQIKRWLAGASGMFCRRSHR